MLLDQARLSFRPPLHLRPRWGHGAPSHRQLSEILDRHRDRYRAHLERFVQRYGERVLTFPLHATTPAEPSWATDFLPGADLIALYGFVSDAGPSWYVEIGSGTSTKVARRAMVDHGHASRILSIDPEPRTQIDELCDETIRAPLEDVPLSTFDRLQSGDILFYDGTHRCLPNSDVTTMFLDVLPRVPPGVLVHIHDILLPDDYDGMFLRKLCNEQYLLASYLLGGHEGFDIELPNWFCHFDAELHSILEPLWNDPRLDGVEKFGSSFWVRTR
jgi:hypothetical protein